jgi:hypothetical protein
MLLFQLPFWSSHVHAQLPPQDPRYKLVFHDEFEATHPPDPVDTKKWARTGPSNQQSNVTGNISWCFPGDTTAKYWDRAYIIRDPKDTTTVCVKRHVQNHH